MKADIKKISFSSKFFSSWAKSYRELGLEVNQWLVENYTQIREGQELFIFHPYSKDSKKTFESPYSGFLIVKPSIYDSKDIRKGDVILKVYPDESYLKYDYPYSYSFTVSKDDFTKKTIISSCFYCDDFFVLPFDYVRKSLSLGNKKKKELLKMPYLWHFNFENVSGRYYLLYSFSKKYLKLDRSCSLHMLMDNGAVVTLLPETNPVNDVCRFSLSLADVDELESSKFIKWRITNGEGVVIRSGDNVCYNDKNDKTGIIQRLSYELFQNFIKDFRKIVRANIPKEELEMATLEKTGNSSTCYVYLMNDTTNNFYKIGISNKPKYREHTLQSDKPTIELICAKEYPTRAIAEAIESALHRVYGNKRIRGEWFNLDTSDVEDIKNTLK